MVPVLQRKPRLFPNFPIFLIPILILHFNPHLYFKMCSLLQTPPRNIFKFLSTRRHAIYLLPLPHFIKVCFMTTIWLRRQTSQPDLVLYVGIHIDTGTLRIRGCCNVNSVFSFPVQCSYGLHEGKRSLHLITLLSGYCDADGLCLL